MPEEKQKDISATADSADLKTAESALPDGQSARSGSDEPESESLFSVIAAVAANVLIAVVKFIASAISGSSAMFSEGIHSLVDSGNGLLILLGMKKASKKPDIEHPFGYSHELYFWTLIVAIMIFALGGGFSIYEGIAHIQHPAEMGDPTMNYIIIAISAVIEGTSFSIAVKSFNKVRGQANPLQFIKQAKDPSLFTVVFEDSAALLGLIIAACGIFFSRQLGIAQLDGAASVLIGILLCAVAIMLLKETKSLLVGEGLGKSELEQIERIVEENDEVVECGLVLTLYLGPHDLLVNIDVTFEQDATRDDIIRAIDAIEFKIVGKFPDAKRIFIESESLRYTTAQDVTSPQ